MVNVVSRGGGSVAPEADAAQSRAALRKQRGAQRAQLPKEHGAGKSEAPSEENTADLRMKGCQLLRPNIFC